MQTELEVKFCNIDIADMRRRLKKAGAICHSPMRLMRRALIVEPHHQAVHSFIRVRDEGDKITLTYKRRADHMASTLDGTKEIEVTVSDFDKTLELFKESGWQYKTFQESRRETWQLGMAEVVIDEWPWLAPYIEIEAGSEPELKQTAEQLGLNWSGAIIGHIDAVYELEYKFAKGFRGVIDLPEARFNEPLPKQFLPRTTK